MNDLKKYTLLLGSNLGDKAQNLKQCLLLLESNIGTIVKTTTVHETEPWGNTQQDSFLNLALEIETYLVPLQLLEKTQEIETQLGRKRTEKWGPRTIDIDILYCDELVFENENLTIPHPYLHQRKFTLELLAELAPDFIHPLLQKNNKELLAEVTS